MSGQFLKFHDADTAKADPKWTGQPFFICSRPAEMLSRCELMLEIIIGNYLNNEQSIRLRFMVYEDDAVTGRMFYLPTDADVVSVHTTQTITMPLSRLVDPLTHEKVRAVITGISIDDSIATFNNEFTIYLGGTIPESVPALPDTGDSGNLLLWAGLFVAGLGAVILTGIVRSRKRRK